LITRNARPIVLAYIAAATSGAMAGGVEPVVRLSTIGNAASSTHTTRCAMFAFHPACAS
jgi:hypothetical protein